MKMWQTLIRRETDKEGIRSGNYVVFDCFQVDVDLGSKYYGGRRIWRNCPKKFTKGRRENKGLAVVFLVMECRRGAHVSIRRLMGLQFQKAGRK